MIACSVELETEAPSRILKTDTETRTIAKTRRDALAADGLCINGKSHGRATHGVRCKRCYDVHRGGTPPARVARTHCRNGHEFTPENTRIDRFDRKQCRTCHRIREACRRKGLTRAELAGVYEQLLAESFPRPNRD